MSIDHLLSKSPTNFTTTQRKLPFLQSSKGSGMEHPLIIPLQSGATTTTAALSHPHELLPVPLLNQQLLVPLAAFQTTHEEPLSLITTPPNAPASSFNPRLIKSPSAIHILSSQSPGQGMNLISTKADTANPFPLISDSVCSQIFNHPLHIQPKSNLNQSIPVQYIPTQSVAEKNKTLIATISHIKSETNDQKPSELLFLQSATDRNVPEHASSVTAADLRKNSDQVQENQEIKVPVSSSNDVPPELDSESLSKVISSLPPGWKVVGLTHLADGAQPTPVVETRDNFSCKANAAPGDCVSSPTHHRCAVPEVVSVDLNIPTTFSLSADVFNDCLVPIDLAAKSQNNNCNKTSFLSSSNSTQVTSSSSVVGQIKVKEEVGATDTPAICSQVSQNQFDMDKVKSEWKVIGLTTSSFPPTSATEQNAPVSNIPIPFPLLFAPEVGDSGREGLANSRSSKSATILNVPTPKLLQQPAKTASPPKASSSKSDLTDDVRWTIVGVTMANATNISSSNDAPASMLASKVKNVNPEINKADCNVTTSQQRPVSSSESKSAPLPSETSQKGLDSSLIEDQWKVIGITHSPCENQISPIPSINYPTPVPLPQVQQSSLIASIAPPPPPPSSSSTTNEVKLISTTNKPAAAAGAISSSTTCLSGNISSSNLLNNTLSYIPPPPPLLTSPLVENGALLEQQQQQLFLNLVQNQLHLQLQQQQEQRQLILNQLQSQFAFQSQIPVMNSVNEWNLVGLLSNMAPTPIAPSNPSESKELKIRKTSAIDNKPIVNYSAPKDMTNKDMLVSNVNKGSKNHESSVSDYKKSRRSRDLAVKFTKKNTVSHLLKLKRMKMRTEGEDDTLSLSDQEGYEVDKNMKQVKEQMELINKSDNPIRSRPLHSYAGNRKVFSKPFSSHKDEGKQRINLRSGNQVPMTNVEMDCDEKNWLEEGKDSSAPENGDIEACNETSPPVDTRSSARKRKLKIPRKMVADVDYQPFDSSSDSN